MTPDGRFVVFLSRANNLTTNDVPAPGASLNVYLRDRASHRTIRVSTTSNGGPPADGDSYAPEVSADGRFVVFESHARNLTPNDTNQNADVFLRDVHTGMTSLVSVNADGTGPANGWSGEPSITPDGRYVLFSSSATNLVAGDLGSGQFLYIRDLQDQRTLLVNVPQFLSWKMGPRS